MIKSLVVAAALSIGLAGYALAQNTITGAPAGTAPETPAPGTPAPAFAVPVTQVTPLWTVLPQLGTWQSVVLVDLNRDNPRRSVRLSFIQG